MEVPNRDQHEDELLLALLLIFDDLSLDLLHDRIVPWDGYRSRLLDALTRKLAGIYLLAAMVWSAGREGFDVDTQAAGRAAINWAVSKAGTLAGAIVSGIQAAYAALRSLFPVGSIVSTNAGDGVAASESAAQRAAYLERLATIADRSRAEAIAITEITAAQTAGGEYAATEYVAVTGISLNAVWITERDSRVCPICNPLQGTKRDVWSMRFPNGPPAHPRCRCVIVHQ